MGSSAARRVSAKVSRSPRKANARSSASDKQFIYEAQVPQGKVAKFLESDTIFAQGGPARNAYYIQEGGVKLSVINKAGREAIVAILGPGNFFGEGCLAGQSHCIATATAIVPSTVRILEKGEVIRLLHQKREFFDHFIEYVLARHIRVEEDLIDQLFNISEKRLARTLLLLANVNAPGKPRNVVSNISQETLSKMIGTTRSRVNFFMNKFRKLGFIQYTDGEIRIHESLFNFVLHD
jgi:CRP/FNR family transcriptional regulator, cyclic AMP receptor protein